jgi:WhiB family transcriptional regulator, redox-sensing transcriptional regulator
LRWSSAFRSNAYLRPVSGLWDWQESARCQGMSADLFFVPDGETRRDRLRRQRLAKSVCAQCPVRVECGDFALRSQQPFGIWGGMTEHERQQELMSKTVIAISGTGGAVQFSVRDRSTVMRKEEQ